MLGNPIVVILKMRECSRVFLVFQIKQFFPLRMYSIVEVNLLKVLKKVDVVFTALPMPPHVKAVFEVKHITWVLNKTMLFVVDDYYIIPYTLQFTLSKLGRFSHPNKYRSKYILV